MYVNVPPIKLCAHCILLCPKYGHLKVEDGIKYYGLELRDIEYLPIIDGMFSVLSSVQVF
jgi:hypothetical protein